MGKNISDLAREQKRDAFDIVVDLILNYALAERATFFSQKK
jgi:hypothetical protein